MVLLAAESWWHFSRHVAWLLLRSLGATVCTAVSSRAGAASGRGRNGVGTGLSVGPHEALGIVASLRWCGSTARAQCGWRWRCRGSGSRAVGGGANLRGRRLGRCRLGQLWHCRGGKGETEPSFINVAHLQNPGMGKEDQWKADHCYMNISVAGLPLFFCSVTYHEETEKKKTTVNHIR